MSGRHGPPRTTHYHARWNADPATPHSGGRRLESPAHMTAPTAPHPAPPVARYAPYLIALTLPPLWAFPLTPSPTLLNQLWAVWGWGLCLLFCSDSPVAVARRHTLPALVSALALMVVGVIASWDLGSLPTSLALPPLALLLMAIAAAGLGARACAAALAEGGDADPPQPFAPFAVGLVVAGVLSAIIAVLQVFHPQWTDGNVIARSGIVGRAVGNLRQPNHLSSLLLWGLIALVPLAEWRPRARPALAAIGALLVFGVLLSGSRTGLLGLGLLSLWGLVDWRLSRPVRLAVISVPLLAAAMWFGMDWWAENTKHVFGAEGHLAEKDISSSRFGIWGNTLAMIRQQPWTGVGWGEFNFAWTLTPFPGRPTAFFDHTHNLVLQLLVELGLPLGTLILLLLVLAFWQAAARALLATGASAVGARAAWVMVAMVLVHSLLEYPLWYAYFLLPTAWAWGFALGAGADAEPRPADAPPASGTAGATRIVRTLGSPAGLRLAGAMMIVGALVATWDYTRVSEIFTTGDDEMSLPARIVRGQRSPLFAHHADYAAATTAEMPSRALDAFERATHALIDGRLMIAWANAFAESGDLDRARYVAARLREFDKSEADDFFKPCADPAVAAKPYQCLPPSGKLSWRDFR